MIASMETQIPSARCLTCRFCQPTSAFIGILFTDRREWVTQGRCTHRIQTFWTGGELCERYEREPGSDDGEGA